MNGIKAISKRYLLPLLLLLILALLATMPQYAPPYTVILFISIFMYVILSVSWTAFSGPTNYISLATAAFFGIGVYTSALLQALPLPSVIVIAGFLCLLLGLLVGLIALRLRGMYFIIFTFGLSELLRHTMIWYEINITGTAGRWLTILYPEAAYYYMLGIVFVTLLVTYLLGRSKFGLAMRSIGEAEEASGHIGINVNAVKIITFAITAFFIGAAGAVMAPRWSYIDPRLAFNPFLSFYPVVMALFGGIGQFYGPILGAVIITVLSDMVLVKFPLYNILLLGLIFIVVILFLPNGLVGLIRREGKRAPPLAGIKLGSGWKGFDVIRKRLKHYKS
jgi:branched-chain amino acid transport system permease protein